MYALHSNLSRLGAARGLEASEEKVKLASLTPMLGVTDVRVSVEFYTQQLGFKLGDTAEHNGDLCWAHLCHGDTEIMLTEVANPETGREGRKQFYLYFYVEDVVALHAKLGAKEIAISPMRVTGYAMKEFEVEDPDGYQLWFGEDSNEPPTDCE